MRWPEGRQNPEGGRTEAGQASVKPEESCVLRVQRIDKVPQALCRGTALTHWSNGKPFSRPFVRVRKRFLTKSRENRRACRRFSI